MKGLKRRNSALMKTAQPPPPPPPSAGSKKNINYNNTANYAASNQTSSTRDEKTGLLLSSDSSLNGETTEQHSDRYNYALLIGLYTLQGIPMGLSASIPFLIQQKIKAMAAAAAAAATSSGVGAMSSAQAAAAAAAAASTTTSTAASAVAKLSYNANAIFALCSWPFSLKLLWAPIVDALFFRKFGRRKTWLVPVQALAGMIMVLGSSFVERQLGLGNNNNAAMAATMNVKGVTAFFFVLYFLMATQDIAVDGWALTMLSKKNRGRGPICNSIGQNVGYFLSFVGFLALNDAESSEKLWRPLFGLPSKPGVGLVSLGGFIKFMGMFMLAMTTFVALFKREENTSTTTTTTTFRKPTALVGGSGGTSMMAELEFDHVSKKKDHEDDDEELDASEIGLKETYHRLWAVCQLPAVRWLFVILLTYRLPTALSDNVKFLKAVEFGLSKSTTALLSPTVILPLGIAVPIVAAKVWHGHPLRQFMTAYKVRITLVPLFDILMLWMVRLESRGLLFWLTIICSTALQAIVNSLQFNAQMTFFASRVDPAIGGTYMTLLNTAANLGGTWPSSVVMYLVGKLTVPPACSMVGDEEVCTGGRDAYYPIQLVFSVLGCLWILLMGRKVQTVAALPDDAWRTHLLDEEDSGGEDLEALSDAWRRKDEKAE